MNFGQFEENTTPIEMPQQTVFLQYQKYGICTETRKHNSSVCTTVSCQIFQ